MYNIIAHYLFRYLAAMFGLRTLCDGISKLFHAEPMCVSYCK